MRRMIEELYFGNINPNEQQFIRDTDYDKAMHILSDNEEKLTLLLSGKEKELFLDFIYAQGTVNGITALENYINGFRLGMQLGVEIMDDQDGCLRDIT